MKRYVLIALAFLFSISVIHAQNPSDCPRVMPSGDRIFTDPAQRYQWLDKDGNPIPNAQNCDYIPTQDGRYAVQVSGISAPFRFDPNGNKPKVLKGKVLDFFLKPVAKARIRVQNQTVTTDNQGEFSIPFTGTVGRRETVHCQKNGYFTAVQGFHPSSAETLYTQFILSERKTNFTFDSQKGGIFSHPGVWVNLPANGYVDEAGRRYKGKVNLSYRSARPGDPHFGALMPGGDFLAINAGGQVQALQSYGFTEVILSDEAGKPLQLAPGVTSELRFLIPEGMEAKAPPTMPLWYLPESEGIWREEGTLRRVGSYYIGRVGHFTPWNCDRPYPPTVIRGRVVDCLGKPVGGAIVTVDGSNYLDTNENGYYYATVGAELPFTIQSGLDFISDTSLANGDTLTLRNLISSKSPFEVFVYGTQTGNRIEIGIAEIGMYPPILVSFDNGSTFQEGTSFMFDIDSIPDFPKKVIVRSGSIDSCQQKEVTVRLYNPTIMGGCSVSDYDVLGLNDTVYSNSYVNVDFLGPRPYPIPNSSSNLLNFNMPLEGIEIWAYEEVQLNTLLTNLALELSPCIQFVAVDFSTNQTKPMLPTIIPSSLKELHLRKSDFHNLSDADTLLLKWLRIPTLEFMSLIGFRTQKDQVQNFFEQLPNLKRLILGLTSNSLLNHALTCTTLKKLELYEFGYYNQSDTVSIDSTKLTQHPSLETLHIEGGIFSNGGINFPLNMNQDNEQLQELIFKNYFSVYLKPDLKRFKGVKSLSIINCNLRTIPVEVTLLPNLEVLHLSNQIGLSNYNQISTIPQEITNLRATLKKLILTGNPIPTEQRATIQSWLPNTTIIW